MNKYFKIIVVLLSSLFLSFSANSTPPEVGHVHVEDERREAAALFGPRPLLGTPRLERLCVRVELDDVQVKLRDASGRDGGWVSLG